MPVLWNESHSVNVYDFDDDHKQLFSLINLMEDAISKNEGAAVAQKVVLELEDYATHHFCAEEAMMKRTGYPELSSHHAEHMVFMKELTEIERSSSEGKGGLSMTMVVFLNEWLVEHILKTDRDYSDHLNANGLF